MVKHTAEKPAPSANWLKIKPYVLFSMTFSVQERYHLRLKLEIEQFLSAHRLRIKHIHDKYLAALQKEGRDEEKSKEREQFDTHMRLLFRPRFVSPLGNQDLRVTFLSDSHELGIRMPSFEYGRNQHYGVYLIPDFSGLTLSKRERENLVDLETWFGPEDLSPWLQDGDDYSAQMGIQKILYDDNAQAKSSKDKGFSRKINFDSLPKGIFHLDYPVQGQTFLKIDNFIKFDLGLLALKGVLETSVKKALTFPRDENTVSQSELKVLPLIGIDWNEITVWTFSHSVRNITNYVKSVATECIGEIYCDSVKETLYNRIKASFIVQKLRTLAFLLQDKFKEEVDKLTTTEQSCLIQDFQFLTRILAEAGHLQYEGHSKSQHSFTGMCEILQSMKASTNRIFPEILSESIFYKAFFERKVHKHLFGKIDFLFVDFEKTYAGPVIFSKINPIPYSSTYVGVPLEYIIFCCFQKTLKGFKGLSEFAAIKLVSRTSTRLKNRVSKLLGLEADSPDASLLERLLDSPENTTVLESVSSYFTSSIISDSASLARTEMKKYVEEMVFVGALLTQWFYQNKHTDTFSVHVDIPMFLHGFKKIDHNSSKLRNLDTVLGKPSLRKWKKKTSIWQLTKTLYGVYDEIERYLFSSSYTSISLKLKPPFKSSCENFSISEPPFTYVPEEYKGNLQEFSKSLIKKVSTKYWRIRALTPKMLTFFRQLIVDKDLVDEYLRIVDAYNYHIEDNVQFENLLEYSPILWKVYNYIDNITEYSPDGYITFADDGDRPLRRVLDDLSHLSESFRSVFYTRFSNAKLDPDTFNRTMEKTGVFQTLLSVAAGVQRLILTNLVGSGWERYIDHSSLLVERDEKELMQGNQLVPETTISRRYLFDLEHLAQFLHESGHSYNYSKAFDEFCLDPKLKAFLYPLFHRADQDLEDKGQTYGRLFKGAKQVIPDLVAYTAICDSFQDFLDYFLFHLYNKYSVRLGEKAQVHTADSETWLRLAILKMVVEEKPPESFESLVESMDSHFKNVAFRHLPNGDHRAPTPGSVNSFFNRLEMFKKDGTDTQKVFEKFRELLVDPFKKIHERMKADFQHVRSEMRQYATPEVSQSATGADFGDASSSCVLFPPQPLDLTSKSREAAVLAQLKGVLGWIIAQASADGNVGQNLLTWQHEGGIKRTPHLVDDKNPGNGEGLWDLPSKSKENTSPQEAIFCKINETPQPWGFDVPRASSVYLHGALGAFTIKTSARKQLFLQRSTALLSLLNCVIQEKGVLAAHTLDRQFVDENLTKKLYKSTLTEES